MSGPERRTIHMSHYKGGSLKDKLDQGDKVFKTVDDFVNTYVEDASKRRPIKKMLVATNGIAAVRCILSIRKLLMQLFRNDRIIKFICLTTEQEIRSNAEYLKLADHFVFSPGGDNRNNYANVEEIVNHAVEKGVDAVWAGWGHASENPELPKQLAAHGIVFIGPPSSAMFSLGDKIASTIIAQTLDIPTIEWSGSGLKLDLSQRKEGGEFVTVTQELFDKATVSDLYEGLRALEEHKIGYPLMIKASEGGGGKGIRKCKNEADFKENFVQVQTEVPGSPIFIMKCVENARHIEVQLIADRYENVIPVFTRDCSIQRRCQKIIEEAPASIAPKETLRRMQEDAVKIAKLVGYESAGTVEYMYLPDEDKYFFLELNPRLQVEHPCTEMLASINIPAIQMQIAMGLPLNRITDIRLFYGLDRYGTTPLPEEIVLTDTEYSVIAARITSEDPEDFFRPSTGSVEVLNFRSAQNVWGYFSVSSAGKVHEFADSQFGHLFARGRTRHEAVSVMLCALQELELRASFASQVSYLVDMLKEPDFTENRFNTQWLDNRIANKVLQKVPLPKHEMIAISSAVIGHARVTAAFSNFRNAVERGQVLPTKDLTETFLFDLVKDMSIYKVTVTRSGPLNYIVSLNGGKTQVEIRLLGDGSLLVTHQERSYTCNLEETSDKFKVTIGRSIVVFEKDNDPSILKSPYTGKLLSYKKPNREWVSVGAVYASVESMKLVFNVENLYHFGLEHVAKEGDLLYPGSVIARLVDQKDGEKYRPKPFLEPFPEWTDFSESERVLPETKKHNMCFDMCMNILNGSIPPGANFNMKALVEELFSYLESETLPFALFKQALSPMVNRLPDKYSSKIKEIVEVDALENFALVKAILDDYFGSLSHTEWEMAKAVCNTVYQICERFENGLLSNTGYVLNLLLAEYKQCEKFFEGRVYDDAVALLNEENKLMMALLKAIEDRGMHLVGVSLEIILCELGSIFFLNLFFSVTPVADNLREIGNMFHTDEVCNQARQLLLQNSRVKYRKFLNKIVWDIEKVNLADRDLKEVLSVTDAVAKLRCLFASMMDSGMNPKDMFNSSPWVHKVIHEFFFDEKLADFAIRAYIGLHFAVDDVTCTALSCDNHDAKVYDFFVDNSNLVHYMISPSMDSSQYLSIIKISVNRDNFTAALTHENLINSLVHKFSECGIKSNGIRSQLRVTLLVNVIQPATKSESKNTYREAQLEELPPHSDHDDLIVSEAENASNIICHALSQKLTAVDILTHVLVCNPCKPLMQMDLLSAERLELWRLPSEARLVSDRLSNVNVFKYDDPDKRFSRLFVREMLEVPIRSVEDCFAEIGDMVSAQLDSACGAINVTMRKFKKNIYVSNHVLMYVTFPKMSPSFMTDYQDDLDAVFEEAIRRERGVLYKHHVTEVEVIYTKLPVCAGVRQFWKRRVKFLDETGVTPEFGIYDEHKKAIFPQKLSHLLYGAKLEPHTRIKKIEKKRSSTRANGTSYVYDYPTLIGRACLEEWKKLQDRSETLEEGPERSLFQKQFEMLTAVQRAAYYNSDYRQFFSEEELCRIHVGFLPLAKYHVKDGEIVSISDKEELKLRADNCNNETGMVAWQLRLYTPEKPLGYTIIAIANDITFQSGSFATPEDTLYSLASEYSRKHKLPRINVSCNSGARIGLCEDISKTFRAKFKDPSHPEEGFEYLYVDASEEQALKDQIVYEKMPNGLLKLKAVVGKPNENIGVENLQGSGLIAGETSAAYDEVPTYCLVTGRTVGIGAYTARLAHRIVQTRSSHLILTGAPALNTLLGKEVYTSNNQLGGIQIMFKNGVTHAVVNDDFEGICKIIQWMSYLPDETNIELNQFLFVACLQIPTFPYRRYLGFDSLPRPVEFIVEPNKPYDIRTLIDSRDATNIRGICDSNSFDEIMNDWAKTIIGKVLQIHFDLFTYCTKVSHLDRVIAGRARICGIPIGIISSELRNVMSVNPADPACPNSQSVEVHQAGQVWYPDSAFKTAEVIGDFNREGLPLLFIASLRGFSGGQRDMFEMVLKFGAHIVDALRQYRRPVIIYIPCHGELRGGAWVVLDSKINPGFITMRNDELMQQLDTKLIEEIKVRFPSSHFIRCPHVKVVFQLRGVDSPEANHTRNLIAKRSEDLKKAYRGVIVELADLHDRPERMALKKAVQTYSLQHVVDLSGTRNLFTQIFCLETAKIHLCEL
uniref:Acetyl-CoA carboxylase n=1 Tax=Heligmosomoides polygyrus TaxID=6339 RepID=A0A8L8K586_HELPZ